MKGKILVGLLLGAIGAIYAFLVYPLLKSSDFRGQSSDRSISILRHLEGSETEPRDLVGIGDSSTSSEGHRLGESIDSGLDPEGQANDIQKELTANSQQQKANAICFNSTCFTIEIADTPALREQGLMYRESLDMDAGMLFVFDTPGSYGFWMKNTLIPLDIIWMDQNFIVVDTATMQPCLADPCPTYNHQGLALYALEINAGLVEKYGIYIDDKASLSW